MKTESLVLSRKPVASLARLGALLAGLVATTPALAMAQDPTPVTVVNSPRQPVPVTGAVAAKVSGTVLVGNSEAIAVKATSAAPEIEQANAQFAISAGDHFGTDDDTVVPAGKVLVFDHVSGRATCEPGQTAWLEVRVLNPDNTSGGVFRIPPSNLGAFPTLPGEPTKQQLIFGEGLHIYVKPGGQYRFSAFRSATTGACVFFISYSAHYVDAP